MLIVWGGEIIGLGPVLCFVNVGSVWMKLALYHLLIVRENYFRIITDNMETACVDVAEHKHTYRTVILKAVASCID